MSLEQAINANTQAINTLVTLMQTKTDGSQLEIDFKEVKTKQVAQDSTPKQVTQSITIDDVRKSIMDVIKATDQNTGHEILKSFGASILPQLPKKHYRKAIEMCDKALEQNP